MKEAALLAQLSPEDLITQINEGSLVAVKVADEAQENYIIEEYDLDAFLKKNPLMHYGLRAKMTKMIPKRNRVDPQ
jgi:hypothetical protein